MVEEDGPAGSPAWMATFADLMSLLMCFFVLLLSFAEMDVEKFKQIAGSMKMAFGVQNEFELEDIPKGTSVVATEFSPGQTSDTPIETIQQITDQTTDPSLRVGDGELDDAEAEELLQEKITALLAETEADAEKLKDMLEDETQTGKVDVESDGRTITVRIREQGSFPSGSATLNTDFVPVMARIRDALVEIPGTISIEGHTDSTPLRGGRYESNWGLSSSRALSVTHELLREGLLKDDRMMVVGFADTRPFTFNDTVEGRASNRRVEIVIRQGIDDAENTELDNIREINPDALDILGIE
ncbi:flagellar motor protein MotB [Congregibacter variabilis]|uniref:Flagellar motor protein MotB n=1 Tax=Congregibacter variabilis TaxID=3081200 RepID=A0ABZ0I1D5_9GAMM|nr:flagellar motor protein MotB [Congregibacter sp. IMCC43200]